MPRTEADRESEKNLKLHVLNFLKQRGLSGKVDKWVTEHPAVNRNRFEMVESALLTYMEFPAIVDNRIGNDGDGEDYSLNKRYIKFMNMANKSTFLNGDIDSPPINIFGALSEVFSSIPENEDDFGALNHFLKTKLRMLLVANTGWDELTFTPEICQSIYWQLLFTLKLAPYEPDGQTEKKMKFDDKRAQLIFGSFIVAVMIAMAYEHDAPFIFRIPNILETDEIAENMVSFIKSEYFRSLSHFFIVGHWMLESYKMEGKMVTTADTRAYTVGKLDQDEIQFAELMTMAPTPSEEGHAEWEGFIVSLLKKGFSATPAESRLVPIEREQDDELVVPSRKRKPVTRYVDNNGTRGRCPKKAPEVFKTPKTQKKKRDMRKKQPIFIVKEEPVDDYEYPGVAPVASPPPPPPEPPKVIPTPAAVGLAPPLYVVQCDLLSMFQAEVERRKREGLHSSDSERVKGLVFNHLDRLHALSTALAQTQTRPLTTDQADVMKNMKKDWKCGNSEGSVYEKKSSKEAEEKRQK